MDAANLTVELPEPKCVKAADLLVHPALAFGERKIPLRSVQELRGCAQFWATAQQAIRPDLGAIDQLLHEDPSAPGMAAPRGSSAEREAAWREWDLTLEMLRLLFGEPDLWKNTFNSSFQGMLTLRERMGLPKQRMRWTSGDTTLERIGAIDWGDQAQGEAPSDFMHDVGELLQQLQSAPGVTDDGAEMIALLELLTFIVLAVLSGARWRGI